MNDKELEFNQVREFVKASSSIIFAPVNNGESYIRYELTLKRDQAIPVLS